MLKGKMAGQFYLINECRDYDIRDFFTVVSLTSVRGTK